MRATSVPRRPARTAISRSRLRAIGRAPRFQLIGEKRGYRYVTFDDATVAAAARADPVGFIDRLPERVILSYTDYVNRTVWRK